MWTWTDDFGAWIRTDDFGALRGLDNGYGWMILGRG